MVTFNPSPRETETLVLGIGFGHAEGPVTLTFTFDDSSAVPPPFVRIWQRDGSHSRDVVTALAFSPTGDDVLSGDIIGGLRYWQGSGNDPSVVNGLDARITDIAISPSLDYSRGSRPFLATSADGTLRKGLASNNDDPNPSTFQLGNNGDADSIAVNAIAYSPDGNFALAAVDDGAIILLDMVRVQAIDTLHGPTVSAVKDVDYGALREVENPYYAVSGSANGTLILWDMSYKDLADLPDSSALLGWLTENRYLPTPSADVVASFR
jgi:WD40 repeat protein